MPSRGWSEAPWKPTCLLTAKDVASEAGLKFCFVFSLTLDHLAMYRPRLRRGDLSGALGVVNCPEGSEVFRRLRFTAENGGIR